MDDIIACFTTHEASRIVGLPLRTLHDWIRHGVLTPSYDDPTRWLGYRYAFSFQDLVTLRTLRQLRDKRIPLRNIRLAAPFLQHNYGRAWSSLRLGLAGQEIVFVDPETGDLISASQPGQKVVDEFVDVAPLAQEVRDSVDAARRRRPEQIGQIETHKRVMGGEPVIAGTRVPVSSIVSFHRAKYDMAAILAEYPTLKAADVIGAIAYEAQHSQQTA
jgi:uncharacterized protein (DUF433 family)